MTKIDPSPSAQVVQHFRVPPENVFEAFLNPEMIGQWMFGHKLRDEEILNIHLDPRTGGTFSFKVLRQGKELDHIGEYLEIFPPRRLVFSWGVRPDTPNSKVTVDLVETMDGCDLILAHHLPPEWADFVEQSAQAWSKMLGVLAEIIK